VHPLYCDPLGNPIHSGALPNVVLHFCPILNRLAMVRDQQSTAWETRSTQMSTEPQTKAGQMASSSASAGSLLPSLGFVVVILVGAAVHFVAPLELMELSLTLIGAGVYLLLTQQNTLKRMFRSGKKASSKASSCASSMRVCEAGSATSSTEKCASVPSPGPAEQATPAKPAFRNRALDQQLDEFLMQLLPSAETDRVACELAGRVEKIIRDTFPEAQVTAVASGDVVHGTAFGVAVPEVDIVATIGSYPLVQGLQGKLAKNVLAVVRRDPRKLHKAAIRVCTDMLVSPVGGFKFRRSAFVGQDPKVTLVAPRNLGVCGKAIPFDFSVNCVTPLRNMVMTSECGRLDSRAKALILLVKRWAKDRGVCQASKGHLSPYGWTLLVVFFLQVGVQGAPLLPPLQGVKTTSGFAVRRGGGADERKRTEQSASCAALTLSQLFYQFMAFYSEKFDWHTEALSVRLAQRSPASRCLALQSRAGQVVGPSIEDPFDMTKNLVSGVTPEGFSRLQEEISRALTLLERRAGLCELLEAWTPNRRMSSHTEEAENADVGQEDIADGFEASIESLGASGTPDRRATEKLLEGFSKGSVNSISTMECSTTSAFSDASSGSCEEW